MIITSQKRHKKVCLNRYIVCDLRQSMKQSGRTEKWGKERQSGHQRQQDDTKLYKKLRDKLCEEISIGQNDHNL